jgi:hypothetical protein
LIGDIHGHSEALVELLEKKLDGGSIPGFRKDDPQ